MKKSVLVSALGVLAAFGSSTAGAAEEVGRVISSSPVIQQVAVPRQVCSNQPTAVQQPNSGTGAVVGGLTGGAVANAISSGSGSGRAAATVIGLIGGALLGNSIENSGNRVQNVQQCNTQTFYENRTVGYNVQYEYAGKEYNVQMPYDPGPTIRLQVSPVGSNGPDADRAAPGYGYGYGDANAQQPMVVAPPVQSTAVATVGYPVYAPAPAYYPAYPYYPSYYPPVGVSLGFGFYGGGRGGHRHWR
jgi:uncharacterized protein YcfJ